MTRTEAMSAAAYVRRVYEMMRTSSSPAYAVDRVADLLEVVEEPRGPNDPADLLPVVIAEVEEMAALAS